MIIIRSHNHTIIKTNKNYNIMFYIQGIIFKINRKIPKRFYGLFFLPTITAISFIPQIPPPPLTQQIQNRHQCPPELRQRIFSFRRHNGINPPADQPVPLQLPQLLCQHFIGSRRNQSVKLTVT